MTEIDTTMVRDEWVEETLRELGAISRLAEKFGVPPSTASRWIEPDKEATGRFIGSVLNNFPIDFDDAFVTIRREVPQDQIRLRRRYTR